jgi:hypothetical protein
MKYTPAWNPEQFFFSLLSPESANGFKANLKPTFGLTSKKCNRVIIKSRICLWHVFIIEGFRYHGLQVSSIPGSHPCKNQIGQTVADYISKDVIRNSIAIPNG